MRSPEARKWCARGGGQRSAGRAVVAPIELVLQRTHLAVPEIRLAARPTDSVDGREYRLGLASSDTDESRNAVLLYVHGVAAAELCSVRCSDIHRSVRVRTGRVAAPIARPRPAGVGAPNHPIAIRLRPPGRPRFDGPGRSVQCSDARAVHAPSETRARSSRIVAASSPALHADAPQRAKLS
jgi:hypothetical protein